MKKAIIILIIAIIAIAGACLMLSNNEVQNWQECYYCGESYDANDENPYIMQYHTLNVGEQSYEEGWICLDCQFGQLNI